MSDQTTNDEQAKYGMYVKIGGNFKSYQYPKDMDEVNRMKQDEQPKREPYLSDEDVVRLTEKEKPAMRPFEVRDHYENLIDTGELLTKEQADAMVKKALDQYAEDHKYDNQGQDA